jgi:hypothetical protein
MGSIDVHSDYHKSAIEKQFRGEDLLQYCDIFSSEFNKSALHDRILVIKVMKEYDDVKLLENCQYDEMNTVTEDNPIASKEEPEKVSTS